MGKTPRPIRHTFCVITSFEKKHHAAQLAGFLNSRRMRWAFDHDWTAQQLPLDDLSASVATQKCIQAAVDADVFVLLVFDQHTVEEYSLLGARLAHNKEAHVIRQHTDVEYLCHKHPCVIEHADIQSFITYVFSA